MFFEMLRKGRIEEETSRERSWFLWPAVSSVGTRYIIERKSWLPEMFESIYLFLSFFLFFFFFLFASDRIISQVGHIKDKMTLRNGCVCVQNGEQERRRRKKKRIAVYILPPEMKMFAYGLRLSKTHILRAISLSHLAVFLRWHP